MIAMSLGRVNDPYYPARTEQVTVARALEVLVAAELAFGASVQELTETRIALETPIFSHRDTTVFEGAAEEMVPLVNTAGLYVLAQTDHGSCIRDAVAGMFTRTREGVSPFVLSALVGPLAGRVSLRIAVLLGCGVENPAEVERFAQLSLGDLTAGLSLAYETGTPVVATLNALMS